MTNHFEDELDKIRIALYEEFKDMSNEESARIIGERARKIAEEFHIKIIKESPRKSSCCDLHRVS